MARALLPAALALVTVALFAACGGSGAATKAREAFGDYLAQQAERREAEAEFNRAFRTIATAAEARGALGSSPPLGALVLPAGGSTAP
jgi:hypothetical protein